MFIDDVCFLSGNDDKSLPEVPESLFARISFHLRFGVPGTDEGFRDREIKTGGEAFGEFGSEERGLIETSKPEAPRVKWYRDESIGEREIALSEGGREKLAERCGEAGDKAVLPGMDSMREKRVVIVGGDEKTVEGLWVGITAGETDGSMGSNMVSTGRAILLEPNR